MVILPKLDSNRRFFSLCDLEIRWMTSKNYRAPLLHYTKLNCASSQIPRWKLLSGNAQFGSKSAIFCPVWPWNLMDDLEKTIGHLFHVASRFVYHFIAISEFKLKLQSINAQFGSKSATYCPVWPWNLTDDLEQGQSEGFESCDRPIVRKRPIWVKMGDVLSRVTLKFDGLPWKTIGHLSFAVPSFVQHFIAIGEFKLELQSGNAQFGSNSTIFLSRVTLKFDRWHWKTIGHLFYATSSFVHHFVAIGKLKLELQSGNAKFESNLTILEPCDLEIWQMTLKNNRPPLQYYFKLCVAFGSHLWIQTGVTVRKRPIWVKIDIFFFSRVTLQFDVSPWKTIGHLFYIASRFVHYFITIGEFKLELQSGNAKFGSKSTIFFRPMTLKNNRAPLLCYFKLCASLRSHWWIQTGVTVRKRPIWVKFDDFFSCVTLKFNGWPWKTIGHIF